MTAAEKTFESAMVELESVVRKLEEGKYSLEEALSAYEKGTELKSFCEEKLRQAKLRVEKIMTSDDGEQKLVPFDGEEAP